MYKVTLNVYDLSNGLARQMSRMILGKQIDMIPHTGIVVYGIEYYYGGGICKGAPAGTPYGKPVQNIALGDTELPQDLFEEFLNEIAAKFSPAKYDLMRNNCNNFCDECAQFLVGNGIPKSIVNLPQEVFATPMGKQLLGMMGGAMDPRTLEGSHNPQQMQLNYGAGSQTASGPSNTGSFGGISQPSGATQGGIKPVTEIPNEFAYNKEIKEHDAVVIDIYADWCGPCQAIKPFFASLPSQFPEVKFFKMDLDKNRFLGTNMGVQSIPTFLFIHKGQLVKKQTGADKNGLTANIKWMISTYKLQRPGGSTVNTPAPEPVKKTIQIYQSAGNPFYFDAEKWELPIKKLKEYGTKQGLFAKPEFQSAETNLILNFPTASDQGKLDVVNYALLTMPLNDPDNLTPFVDFVRLCYLKEDLAK
jgi:desumoylating isopeptidase 1